MTLIQLLHIKGKTHELPDTDDYSTIISRFYDAPLNARLHSPHVLPSVGKRGELDNDCLYIHHPSRRLYLQSPLALHSITPDHSPDLIDNMYLT